MIGPRVKAREMAALSVVRAAVGAPVARLMACRRPAELPGPMLPL